ncbi:GAF domain-containing protein [Cohnella sp. 56]|uniref:GAF domain-containing protein n=1 Tax=Cohnella sp. 56 TaxID=3113722 RepID=UPI0030EAE8BB
MEQIVTSLRKFKETRELKKLLARLDPSGKHESNLAVQLLQLYQEELIGRSEYLALRAKIATGHYLSRLRSDCPELRGALYLYDTDKLRIWNASVSHMPDVFNEYTQGLDVGPDIPEQSPAPVYATHMLKIENVLRSDHPIVSNHYDMYKRAAIQSFVTLPLVHGSESIGYQFISAERPREFTAQELSRFSAASAYLIRELAAIKPYMIDQFERAEPQAAHKHKKRP